MTAVLNHETTAAQDSAKPMAHQPLKAEQVLQPTQHSTHFQSHASLRFDGLDVSIYTRLGSGDSYKDAYLTMTVGGIEGGFNLGMGMTPLRAESIMQGLANGVRKLRQIHALGTPSEVVEVDDWLHYEQTTDDYVDAKTGGVAYRVFANQLEHMSTPEVQLMTYCHHGFAAGSQGLPGFLTPDAADELANALKAAAYRARMMTAEQKAQGGAA
ncbi:hypothetical protein [Comamonas fluminis]|uniref:hypothetical protein n=1 Tax=Comamonas fluminis TaxID=2796366 RepID=UPI001C46ABCA|nr:hypothetical protein [Comamonas fluminis]